MFKGISVSPVNLRRTVRTWQGITADVIQGSVNQLFNWNTMIHGQALDARLALETSDQ
jgi:hypothetical protein